MEKGNIGQYIKIRRVEMDLSQAALGHKIGKSSQVISNWERGYTKGVSVEELAKIAQALDVDIKYFFPEAEEKIVKCPPYWTSVCGVSLTFIQSWMNTRKILLTRLSRWIKTDKYCGQPSSDGCFLCPD